MGKLVYTVSKLNAYIKYVLDNAKDLSGIYVRGEISNCKVYPNGHCYFSLKDEGGILPCMMWDVSALNFQPQNGMKVITLGQVSVYPKDGKYQFYVSNMAPLGKGDLQQAYEQLLAKLGAEGLFDEEHKKPLPKFPQRIAVVTSPVGDAIRDILEGLGKHWPMVQVRVIPCRVQGMEAPPEIVRRINWVNEQKLADLIIVSRGGGSREELWCFNDEAVARAIYASEIPVISAVGHEKDVSISDYVADRRAITPTKAAEIAVPDQGEQYARLDYLSHRMQKAVERKFRDDRAFLAQMGRCPMLRDPMSWVRDRRSRLDRQTERLRYTMGAVLSDQRRDMARLAAGLDAMSPLKVLGRGYAIAKGPKGIVKSTRDAGPGDQLRLQLSDGTLSCTVDG